MSEKKKGGGGFFRFMGALIIVLIVVVALLFGFTGLYATEGSILGLDEGIYWYYKGIDNLDVPFVLSPGKIAEDQGVLGGLVDVLVLERSIKERTILRFPLPYHFREN